MNFRLLRLDQMTDDLWIAFDRLRDARAIYDDPFLDPVFARLVAEVRADTRFGVAFEGGEPVGFWPLHRRPGAWARPVGGPFSDWHGPVLSEHTTLTPHAFLKGLGLLGLSAYGWLPQVAESETRLRFAGANMTALDGDWEGFIANQTQRWPKHFKKMRRLGRNLERDFGEVEFRFDDASDETFELLMALKREQFRRTGRHDVLAPRWAQALLERLRAAEGPRFRLRHVSLYFDGQHAASELLLQSDKVMHGWITAYEQAFAQYSPGNILVQMMLETMAAQDGPQIYDAGPGLDHYKRHYSNYQLPVGSGVVRARELAFRPDRLLGQAWRSGERLSPARLAHLMTQSRRRLDQICLAELTPLRRLNGLGKAFGRTAAALESADTD
ncbi:GNAT family N-acetyltransferase [Henriciella aquimarina]|uniref:GNAT family N-acetyltransferase n=1 Tax=Henriciella aquimarina TaxID=545261 RepID=UPI0009FF399E|nr:GNAT family N-acetyltransferase [Henriciella aquimarina]